MSRAFNIPNQNQRNNNTVGNIDENLVKILVATILTILKQKQICRRNCCIRNQQTKMKNVSFN